MDMADSYIEKSFNIVVPEYIDKTKYLIIGSNETNAPAIADVIDEAEISQLFESTTVVEDPVEVESTATVELDTADVSGETELLVNEVLQNDEGLQVDNRLELVENMSVTVNSLNTKIDSLTEEIISKITAVVSAEIKPVIESTKDAKKVVKEDDSVLQTVTCSKENLKPDPAVMDAEKMLLMARQTFWNGDVKASEKLYLDLTSKKDSDPDAYGELGNVYYSQGKWKQAGKAYFEAASRLLELGKHDQVSYLLRVIQGLDSESAAKLRNQISLKKV